MKDAPNRSELVADIDSRPEEMARARANLVRDSRPNLAYAGAGDVANEEAFIVAALHLLHRKIERGPQTIIDRAILEGAAKLFSSLSQACEQLVAGQAGQIAADAGPKSKPKRRTRKPAS